MTHSLHSVSRLPPHGVSTYCPDLASLRYDAGGNKEWFRYRGLMSLHLVQFLHCASAYCEHAETW